MLISYQKKIEERHKVDLCIVGGGPSGIAAALSAARQGLSVFLAESQGFFGGAATAALVPAFMPFTNGEDFLAGGIGREIYDLCIKSGFILRGRTLGIHAEKFKKILDDLVEKENINFSFFTTLIDVSKDDDSVTHCIFSAKSGLFAVKADIFIDATGDGDLCAWAGAPYEIGDENGATMPSTLCSIWNGIDFKNLPPSQAYKLEEAFADGVFTQEDRHLPGMWQIDDMLGGGNIGHSFGVNSTDEMSLTAGMVTGRKILPEYENYYRNYLGQGYSNAKIAISASYLGVRESRRIMGDYVMTVEDFLSRASFHDEIGRFSYPIDIHTAAPTKTDYETFLKKYTEMRYKDGESYGIPYRILLPKGLVNVYVVGRCVSTDRQMQSSIRVIPACFIMGQAAGIGAALAIKAKKTIREIDIVELRRILSDMGAFLR